MRGLLYKDRIFMLRQFRYLLLMDALFLVMGVMPGKGSYWAVYAELMLSTFAGARIRADEASGWNRYSRLLPLSGKTVVTTYYITTYVTTLLSTALYTVAALIVRYAVRGTYPVFPTVLLMVIVPSLMAVISIPLTLRFGSLKAPIVQMILIALMVAVGVTILGEGTNMAIQILEVNTALTATVALVVTAVTAVVSWFISVRVYERRE